MPFPFMLRSQLSVGSTAGFAIRTRTRQRFGGSQRRRFPLYRPGSCIAGAPGLQTSVISGVPAVYPDSALLLFLLDSVERRMNNLRRIRPGGRSESRRPRHVFQALTESGHLAQLPKTVR